MPRSEGNTPRTTRRHHKNMKSGAHGKGGDAKIKRAKQLAGEAAAPRDGAGRKKMSPHSGYARLVITVSTRLGKAESGFDSPGGSGR